MLEKVTPESPRLWKKDLEQIKRLGFNTVRTWIEWTNCEPEEDRYDFSALRTVVDLAGQADWLKVVRPVEVKVDESDVLVEARWLEGDGGMILFGFNRGKRKAAAEFGVAVPVRREFKKWAQPLAAKKVKIELSVLGENAGLYGAAKLAWDRIG